MGGIPEADDRACPTPAELAAFLCDELSPDQMDGIGAHVSGCRDCDAAVRRMSEATDAGPRARHAPPRRPDPLAPDGFDHGGSSVSFRAAAPALARSPLANADRDPALFQIDQYRIGEQLGQGGMGTVYRAEHVRLKKSVAIKVLSPAQTRDRRAAARFQLEMEVVGRLEHPNIVRATDAGEADGIHFLVMELIEGVNLAHLLLRCGPLPVADACELVRQAAVGLQHAHEHGLVHRDVKPSNLMLSHSGQVKLLDLGLALFRPRDTPAHELTAAGEVMGTAEYMAPEQWEETRSVDVRADVYSLGCTLYALLTGDPPFVEPERRSMRRLRAAHQHDPVPPVTDYRPEVPPALSALVERTLAKSPDARPATPGEVAAALERFAAGASPSALLSSAAPDTRAHPQHPRPGAPAGPQTPVTGAAPPARGRSRALVALAAVALAAVGATAYFAWPTPRAEAPDPKRWRNLLAERHDEARLRRLWTDTPVSKLEHDRVKETLWVQSAGLALVCLGDAPAPAYKLQIGIRQVRWEGGVGVYFGGRAQADAKEFVFQHLALRHTSLGPGREYGLIRGGGKFSLQPNPKPGVRTIDFQTEYVPPPDNEEKMLELEVKPGGLAVVRWEGAACPVLVGAAALESATKRYPGDITGEFGIYCNGTVTVTTARYAPTD